MAETPSVIQPGTPLEDNLARINDNFKAIDDENRTKIIKDGDTPRILFGFQKDGFGTGVDYGLKVSQPGYDVTTADPINLAFSSAYNTFKILATGTFSKTLNFSAHAAPAYSDESNTYTVSHSAGYSPVVLFFLDGGSAGGAADNKLLEWVNTAAIDQRVYLFGSANATDITIDFHHIYRCSAGSTIANTNTYTGRYYILAETSVS